MTWVVQSGGASAKFLFHSAAFFVSFTCDFIGSSWMFDLMFSGGFFLLRSILEFSLWGSIFAVVFFPIQCLYFFRGILCQLIVGYLDRVQLIASLGMVEKDVKWIKKIYMLLVMSHEGHQRIIIVNAID